MVNTKAIGEITEAVVLAEFLKAGFQVSRPFGENTRYDLIVDTGEQLLRVQVKSASPCGNGDQSAIRFHAYSHRFEAGKFGGREAYRGQADLFAAYAPSTGEVYVLPVDEVPETDVWLRLTPARNNQKSRVRMAEDNTIAAWAQRVSQGKRRALAALTVERRSFRP